MIENYTENYARIWELCPDQLPEFPGIYSRNEKLQKESRLDEFLKMVKSFRKDSVRSMLKNESAQEKFLMQTKEFLASGLDFSPAQLEMMFSDQMIDFTRTFVRQARSFDSQLQYEDIFQACRNAWIMAGLQLIMGIPMRVTPSVFAYSMLYPYTDNMIDHPGISNLEKLLFSERFRMRLAGMEVKPQNLIEASVYQLVEMIENEYSRTDYPEVFESLLSIHKAQTESIKLIQHPELSENETLKICLAKGGSSVLTDGFLIAGRLTSEQQNFLFGFGAYLQLLDDIQDVADDYQDGLMTVFSKSVHETPLDSKLNKTYWFGEEMMKSLDYFEGRHIALFKSLMRRSMDLFIAEAIAQNHNLFTRNYTAEFETHAPFHFEFIRKQKDRLTPYKGFLVSAIEEITLQESLLGR
jgi:hypothetical protein